ncbi:MAG: bifunctional oligoribonuclease/PAP phosphatase NrnA [Longimicrobiales bacterium]
MKDVLAVPASRRAKLEEIVATLGAANRIVLTTHVNADGDGTGCEIAVAVWLTGIGKVVHIANPTAWPDLYRHLVPDAEWLRDPTHPQTTATIAAADVALVVDTAEPKRIGRIAASIAGKPVIVIDHHVPTDNGIPATITLEDAAACAAGELIFDLLTVAELAKPWPHAILEAIYTAIVTDTGSFRFSNSTNRAHAIAGDLIEQGIDPEEVYRRLFATVPLRRIELLREALAHLQTDPELPITWISIGRKMMDDLNATSDDVEGLIEHARSVEGTEVAILFRETADGSTKISLRSAANVDVNAIARGFGGGGHVKAAGALMGQRPAEAVPLVLDAVRTALRDLRPDFRAAR